MMILVIVSGWINLDGESANTDVFNLIAGLCGWAGVVLLIKDASILLRIQVGLLMGLGLVAMTYAYQAGVELDVSRAISINAGLLTMITAVGFLRLITVATARQSKPLPRGHKGFVDTLLSTALFGSFINISAPIIIADQIHAARPISRITSQSITRVFCACSSWSPFFAAMAVILTYVGSADLLWIMIVGLPFALISLVVVYIEARWRYQDEINNFIGYPLELNNIWIPVVLMLAVIVGRWLVPELSILVLIATSALAVTFITLFVRVGKTATFSLVIGHVKLQLPRSVNEISLFSTAGVLAIGISSLVQLDLIEIPLASFNSITAIKLLVAMVFIAMIGIHPVIFISSITPLILVLNPDLTLLAITYLFAWNLGTCASFLSGTHLVFQGRYDIPGWRAAIWNMPYVFFMVIIASGWLYLIG